MRDGVTKNRLNVLRGTQEGKVISDTYVTTLPEGGNHILDICPVLLLRKEEREEDRLLVLGMTGGYGEAAEVMHTAVGDMSRLAGTFNWNTSTRCPDNGSGEVVSGGSTHCEEA